MRRDDDNPYLVYSPWISIQNSSEPFQAFLGAILSVHKNVPVDHGTYDLSIELDTINEEESQNFSSENDNSGDQGVA